MPYTLAKLIVLHLESECRWGGIFVTKRVTRVRVTLEGFGGRLLVYGCVDLGFHLVKYLSMVPFVGPTNLRFLLNVFHIHVFVLI